MRKNRVLARLRRGATRITIVPDFDAGFHVILTTPADPTTPPRVERVQSRSLPLCVELYQAAGYQRLTLCDACDGAGMTWYRDRHGEADRDLCPACQGEGGHGG